MHNGQTLRSIVKLAINENGERIPGWERQVGQLLANPTTNTPRVDGGELLQKMEAVLERETKHRGAVAQDQPYSASLVGWLLIA